MKSLGAGPGDTVYVHAGARYAGPLLKLLGRRAEAPLAGLRVGERLHWYRERGF